MESVSEKTYDGKTLEEKLASLSPMYAVVCVNSDGTLSGLVEHSFSMDKSDTRVNIFWTALHRGIDGKKWAEQNCDNKRGWFLVELTSEKCPIEIDWVAWLDSTYKFTSRNALFKTKEGFDFSDAAIEAVAREAYDQKYKAVMDLVTVRNKAEQSYKEKMHQAQKVLDAETAHLQEDFKKLRNKYQSKAKSIAIERGKCPKMPDGRYMNTGNSRVTEYGIQLKWFSAGTIVYTVVWKDLF